MSAPVDVRAVLRRHVALAEQVGCREQQAEAHAIFDAIAGLIEAAGKAQDTNRLDYVLGRPDVSHLPPAEAVVFLRGWDAASEAVYRTGLRAALRAVGGGE